MFVLDRIKMLKIMDERFTPPKDFNVDEFMRRSFKVMYDELYMVKVRISPEWARWVKKIWHESQKITDPPDGGLGKGLMSFFVLFASWREIFPAKPQRNAKFFLSNS